MQFIESIQAALGGQFELSHLLLALLVIVTLVLTERYYSRNR